MSMEGLGVGDIEGVKGEGTRGKITPALAAQQSGRPSFEAASTNSRLRSLAACRHVSPAVPPPFQSKAPRTLHIPKENED